MIAMLSVSQEEKREKKTGGESENLRKYSWIVWSEHMPTCALALMVMVSKGWKGFYIEHVSICGLKDNSS